MTIPSFLSCSPRWISSRSSTACAMLLRFFLRTLIIYFYLRFILDGPDHLVAAGDDLVAVLQSVQHFDIGGAGDSRLHLAEVRLLAGDHEDALHFFLASLLLHRVERHIRLLLAAFRLRLQ